MSGFLPAAGHGHLVPFLPGGGEIPLYASYGKVPLAPEQYFLKHFYLISRKKNP